MVHVVEPEAIHAYRAGFEIRLVFVFRYRFRRCRILKGCWLEGPVPLGTLTFKFVPGPGLEVWQVLQVVRFESKTWFTKMGSEQEFVGEGHFTRLSARW